MFDRIFEIARISNFTAKELSEYEASRMNMLDYNASMKFARKEGLARGEAIGVARGKAKGKAMGIAIGEARGIAIGEAKGREEIFSLLEKGMSLTAVKKKLGYKNTRRAKVGA